MILQLGRSQLGVVTFGMLRTRCFSSPVVVRVRVGMPLCVCVHARTRMCCLLLR